MGRTGALLITVIYRGQIIRSLTRAACILLALSLISPLSINNGRAPNFELAPPLPQVTHHADNVARIRMRYDCIFQLSLKNKK